MASEEFAKLKAVKINKRNHFASCLDNLWRHLSKPWVLLAQNKLASIHNGVQIGLITIEELFL
jgi:hypothetical protein